MTRSGSRPPSRRFRSFVLLGVVALAACLLPTDTCGCTLVPEAGLAVLSTSDTTLAVGDTARITAVVAPSSAPFDSVSWAIAPETSVAVLSSSAKEVRVEALRSGEVTVAAVPVGVYPDVATIVLTVLPGGD